MAQIVSPPGISSAVAVGTPAMVQSQVVLRLTDASILQLARQGIWVFDVDWGPAFPFSDVTPIHGDTVEDLDDAIRLMRANPRSVWQVDVGTKDFSKYLGVAIPDLQAIRVAFLEFTGGLNKKDYYGGPIGNPDSEL